MTKLGTLCLGMIYFKNLALITVKLDYSNTVSSDCLRRFAEIWEQALPFCNLCEGTIPSSLGF